MGIVVELSVDPVDALEISIVIHLTLACGCEDDELMAQVAADRTAVRLIGIAFRPMR